MGIREWNINKPEFIKRASSLEEAGFSVTMKPSKDYVELMIRKKIKVPPEGRTLTCWYDYKNRKRSFEIGKYSSGKLYCTVSIDCDNPLCPYKKVIDLV